MAAQGGRHVDPGLEDFGFIRQLATLGRAFIASPLRFPILAIFAGILAVLVATAFGQVQLNGWNKPFYDAIERRDLPGFFHQLAAFAEIAGGLLVLNVVQCWLGQMLHLKLREGLTRDLITEWMRPGHAFHLANAGAIGVNPDQRVHEDARHLADLSADLGVGLLQAAILLASFVGVLWAISEGFVFHVWDRDIAIPGYMVWAAVLYAGAASCLSWLAGRPLIRLNSERYAREAVLRCSLMRAGENAEAMTFARGEADETRRLERDLSAVIGATRSIVSAVVKLTWVTAGYGWITVVAPIVIASPVYFSGSISFGGLMMAAAAFTQVHASLRWFVDRIGPIADWRATLSRVAAFRAAVLREHEGSSGIAFAEMPGCLRLEDLALPGAGGARLVLSEAELALQPGEHVLLAAAPEPGRALFKALAGLNRCGSGQIALPESEAVAFVPGSPFVPSGSLREALAFPSDPTAFPDTAMLGALSKVGLLRLLDLSNPDENWRRTLSGEERRLFAFARLILHKPRWIVVNEALDLLRDEARRRVAAALAADLAGSAILVIGEDGGGGGFSRTLAFGPERIRRQALDSAAAPLPKRRRNRPWPPLALAHLPR